MRSKATALEKSFFASSLRPLRLCVKLPILTQRRKVRKETQRNGIPEARGSIVLMRKRFGILSDVNEAVIEKTEAFDDHARWAILQRKVQARRIATIFNLFRDNGIEPILIKGFAADQCYPSNVHRESIDVDLAVSRADLKKASELVSSPDAEGMAIDLHNELRHLDTVDWPDLFENTQLIDAEGTHIRVLRPEDHLRVLCVHWLNDGGVNRERLWDIYYLIANRTPDFDWDRALNKINERRRRWIVCTILLAEKYLGLDLSGTPIEGQGSTLPAWLVATVELEWARKRKEIPLWLLTREPREFLKQAGMRLNPNPIRATVEMEGNIDAPTRIHYKFGNLFQRLLPSLSRNVHAANDR